MLSPAHGPAIAAAFDLGDAATLTGPVARGEQGQVWRLDTERGAFAVKDPFIEMSAADALADADYQDAVRAAGVPMPQPLRTPDGRVLVEVAGAPARVYRWVDVLPKQRRLDPEVVGAVARGHPPRRGPHGRGRGRVVPRAAGRRPLGRPGRGGSPRRGRRSPTTSSRWYPASWRPRPSSNPSGPPSGATSTCGRTTCARPPTVAWWSWTGRTAGPGTPPRSSGPRSSCSATRTPTGSPPSTRRTSPPEDPGGSPVRETSPCWSPSSATSPRSPAPGGSTRRPRRSGSASRAGCGSASTSRSPWRR